MRRCSSVLLAKGIPNTRFQAQALGENAPVSENSSDAGKQLNRRVELIVVWQAKTPPSVSAAKKAEKPINGRPEEKSGQVILSEAKNIEGLIKQGKIKHLPKRKRKRRSFTHFTDHIYRPAVQLNQLLCQYQTQACAAFCGCAFSVRVFSSFK